MSSVLRHRVRSGAYHDSIVLMRLQSSLAALDGIEDSGAVMATDANLALLRANRLLPDPTPEAGPQDLLISVRAASAAQGDAALDRIDELLAHRADDGDGSWRPRSLRTAEQLLPGARWALVSVPGRYAAEVAHDALDRGRHVFLYSDNVSLDDERRLKERARRRGLMVLGPDCGTAWIGGTGLGFANRVRRGPVGLIAASGTGLQTVAGRIHALGEGISQAIGTGGRDLDQRIGAVTAHQALDLLARDPWTRVIVLISKPPSPRVATRLLRAAQEIGKPVVVAFLGYPPPGRRLGRLHFARDLEEAGDLAVSLIPQNGVPESDHAPASSSAPSPGDRRFLRGLFSGGTLAYEALLSLRAVLHPIRSNLRADGVEELEDPTRGRDHAIVDLGADELTVGRLHPMMDPDGARRRLRLEADDPETAVILLDLVLGHGAHPDPAGELAETVAEITGRTDGPAVVVAVIGTDEDPQDLDRQVETLRDAGAHAFVGLRPALDHVLELLPADDTTDDKDPKTDAPAVDAADLEGPIRAWNVGLESLHQSLVDQESEAIHVEWRPPAGGDERLAALLRAMKPDRH